jgi:hypothetical protein
MMAATSSKGRNSGAVVGGARTGAAAKPAQSKLGMLWESKALSDVVAVFVLASQTAKARQAVKDYAAQHQGPHQVQHAGSKRPREEGPAWPEGAVVIEAHGPFLIEGSALFEKQLEQSLPDDPPPFISKSGTQQHVLVVGVEGQGALEAAEPLLRLMYTRLVTTDQGVYELLQVSTECMAPSLMLQAYRLRLCRHRVWKATARCCRPKTGDPAAIRHDTLHGMMLQRR